MRRNGSPAKNQATVEQGAAGLTLTAIDCPQCNARIELGAILKAHLAKNIETEIAARIAAAASEAERRTREELSHQLELQTREANEARTALRSSRTRELELIQREQRLVDLEQELALQAAKTVEAERDRIRQAEEARVRAESELNTRALEAALTETRSRLEQSQKTELQLREARESVEARERMLDLEIRRKVDELRLEILEQARNDLSAAHQVEVAERDLQIQRLHQDIKSLKETSAASQELRGEAQEVLLRDVLSQAFRQDEFADVPRGRNGGDLIQTVRNVLGQRVGRIVYESKRTRSFQDAWLTKLKSDQLSVQADLAVLVCQTLPPDLHHIGLRDGIVLTSPVAVLGAAAVARAMLMRVFTVRSDGETRDERLQELQRLITSSGFRLACESVFACLRSMAEDLETERQAMSRWHTRRARRLDGLSRSAAEIIAGLETSIACSIPEICPLDHEEAEPHEAEADGNQ